jgi:hypothetical protein
MHHRDRWFDETWAAIVQQLVLDDEYVSSYAGDTEARGRRGPAPPPHPLSFDASGFPVRQPVPTLTERLWRLTSERVE